MSGMLLFCRGKNLWKHLDFVNKCSMNEYDSFKLYFQALIENDEKWVIPKLFNA